MEMKKLLESLNECGMEQMGGQDSGQPVSMTTTLTASGKEHVADLMAMMKNAGMGGAEEVGPEMMPMRQDMESFRGMVDGDEDSSSEMPAIAPEMDGQDMEDMEDVDDTDDSMKKGEMGLEGYDNEPDEEYQDTNYMTRDLAGGLNREKKAYKAAALGDNTMAVETIKAQLLRALNEKKAKPDFLDVDKDGDKKEPMKKAVKDKKSKKK